MNEVLHEKRRKQKSIRFKYAALSIRAFARFLCIKAHMHDLTAPLLLNLTLTPNRSLSKRGFHVLMGVVTLISCVGAIRFMLLDAWPVALFFLLDVVLLYFAFKLNYRTGQQIEHILLDKSHLLVQRIDSSGREYRLTFNLPWVRVEMEENPATQSRLWVKSSDKSVEIGRFLAPFERVEVKQQIESALSAAAWWR
jgi:uncharacterized membrane protein